MSETIPELCAEAELLIGSTIRILGAMAGSGITGAGDSAGYLLKVRKILEDIAKQSGLQVAETDALRKELDKLRAA
tara:strand:+ start:125 stop:352 length:228 start_codon:yes stop_codon:yes gene_type:complete